MARLKNTDVPVSTNLPLAHKKTSSAFFTYIILGIISLVLVVTIASFALSPAKNTLPDMNLEQDVPASPDNSANTYTTSMNSDWYFEDGTSPSSNAYVENSVENSCTIYFEVLLANTGETAYSSPYIPVGSALEHPALSVDLDAGDYNATCLYHLVDSSNNELSTVSVPIILHILN